MGQAAEREARVGDGEHHLAQLAHALPSGIVVVRDGCVQWVNAAFAELAGRDGGALIGTSFTDLFADAGQGLPDAARSRPLEYSLRRPAGAERRVLGRLVWPALAPGCDAWWFEDVTQLRA